MRKDESILTASVPPGKADRLVALMLSQGIDARAEIDASGHAAVLVDAAMLPAARALMGEEYPYGLDRDPETGSSLTPEPTREPVVEAPSGWFGRGAYIVLAVFAACIGLFIFAQEGGDVERSRLLELGAITHSRIEQGEYWRLLAAVFLHFDIGHLASNMMTLLILGPPLAHIAGPWRFAVLFAATGVGANIVSHELHPIVGMKAGASGAISGLLGALCGHAMRDEYTGGRIKRWQRLGALAAAYGVMIGIGPGRDNVAHAAGAVIGVLLGYFTPSLRSDRLPSALQEAPRQTPTD